MKLSPGRPRRIQRRQRIAQAEGAVARLTDLQFEPGEIERRRREMQPRHRGRTMRIAQRRFANQDIVGRVLPTAAVDAEAGRGIALRVEIDDQHLLADGGERGAEIDRRRRLADAALLVGDRKHPRRLGELHLRRAIGRSKRHHYLLW